jgi:transposase
MLGFLFRCTHRQNTDDGNAGVGPGSAATVTGEKVRAGGNGPQSSELCRREGIAERLYYSWSKKFLEVGKRRLVGDTTARAAAGEKSDAGRRVLQARPNNPAEKRKDQTQHNTKPTLATPKESRLN